MSVLIRFNSGLKKYKVRMFEQASKKIECRVCANRKYGILLRFVDPVKHEKGICHECLVKIAEGLPIQPAAAVQAVIDETTVKKTGPKKKVAKKAKKTKKTLFKKLKGQDNDRTSPQEATQEVGDCGTDQDQRDQAVS